MKGSPETGTIDFGIMSLTGRNRLAVPPARIATGIMGSDGPLLRDDLGAFEVEAEADFGKPGCTHGVPQAGLVLGIEHQKASAARSDQLAADGTVRDGKIVPFID